MKDNKKIPFNIPFLSGSETKHFEEVISSKKFSGNGNFTKKCLDFFYNKYQFKNSFLTSSCTDALEMCGLLLNIKLGDEIIVPAYTYVASANAFALRGAKIVFVDSNPSEPNIDENKIEESITTKTKAIVVVHYAGVACNMNKIKAIAKKHNLVIVEDAAQSLDAFYIYNEKKYPLGSIGNLATFSFHDTKNITCGEGGLLVVNDENFINNAEIIHQHGTNKTAYLKGEVAQYEWVGLGSSFLPSEITSSFLFAQLQYIDIVQAHRISLWEHYFLLLKSDSEKGYFNLPFIPVYATNNAHIFYILLPSKSIRDKLINYLRKENIQTAFHYQALHTSKYFIDNNEEVKLLESEKYSNQLLRLPLYYNLTKNDIERITLKISEFFKTTLQ
jgi:dTDP-4-amino-4,6-dideoxygalactose transaminase